MKSASLCAASLGMGAQYVFASSCSSTTKAPELSSREPVRENMSKSSSFPKVVCREDQKVFGGDGHDVGRVRMLVNNAVCSLVGVGDPKEAFRALFSPTDTVAIKPNCLAGPGMSTSVSVIMALVGGLRSIGIKNSNIIIWERTSAELEKAGFKLNRYSDFDPKCYGNDEGGFESNLSSSGKVGSLWSMVVASRATALINVPVLKDHDLAGVGCGMKNMYGAIHNPNRYHDNNCDPYVADVNAHPYIKDKSRLIVVDALTAQYHGGPANSRAHQWRAASIIAGSDPVAVDSFALRKIEEQRARHGLASLEESKRPPKWLHSAASIGLGTDDLSKMTIDEC